MRFSYDVSPPPPPPLELSAYRDIVDDDPESYVEVRRRLESWFPKLSHVATSSMGAGIGPFIADFVVSPMQLTRAFLSSQGMEADSLGARVVESKHTGRWRFACHEMHDYFGKTTSPGRQSHAYHTGREDQHSTHSGRWDRNPLVAAMLEIKLSMSGHPLDETIYDTLGLYDRICGGAPNRVLNEGDHTGGGPAGYRVPVNAQWDPTGATYEDGGVALTDFAPIVAFGSLDTLRSMRMTQLGSCPPGLAPEDAVYHQYCANQQTYLSGEMTTRSLYAPFSLQRDVWCNPHEEVTLEQSVGNPEYFDTALYDTELKSRFSIDNLVVQAIERGEENIADKRWVKRSLQSWVFVTSSSHKDFRAGMHRLVDIPLFRDQVCNTLPNVQCSSGITTSEVQVKQPTGLSTYYLELWKSQNYGTRMVSVREDVRLNTEQPLVDGLGSSSEWQTGREALPQYRCSAMVTTFLGVDTCFHAPYALNAGCSSSDNFLSSKPVTYGAKHWLSRLAIHPPPPPPPPPPNPSPPFVDHPSPPPGPPVKYSQGAVMSFVRKAEERMCTSVYFLSQTTRCERLALDLTQRWLLEFNKPPNPPPILGTSPSPPPSPPPSPSLPSGFSYLTNTAAYLSTFRIPVELPAGTPLDNFGYYTPNLAALKTTLASVMVDQRACVPGAPLVCVSGSLETQCLNGRRRCDTAAMNAENPFVEINFKLTKGSYLWGLEATLPRNTQLSEKFVGPKKIEVFGTRDEPLPCGEGDHEVVGIPSDYRIVIVCHPASATDGQIHALSSAYRVKLTLEGTFRQVWMDGFRAMERPLSEATDKPAPSPPPPRPDTPPTSSPEAHTMGNATNATCGFYPHTWVYSQDIVDTLHEPCGLTKEQCCDKKFESGAGAFHIDDAGCCDLLFFSGGKELVNVTLAEELRSGSWGANAGTGS